MKKSKIASHDLLVNQRRVTLLELLDRLLDKGVVAKGEIILSVAEIDLVYLNLGLLLSSVKSVEKARGISGDSSGFFTKEREADDDFFKEENPNIRWVGGAVTDNAVKTSSARWQSDQDTSQSDKNTSDGGRLERSGSHDSSEVKKTVKPNGEVIKVMPRTNIDPNNVEKGLAKLVLTLIELLRRLMEKQAIRRMEAGFLTASEVEQVGIAFQGLEEKMKDLKLGFSLRDEDLNLDLGPLGELM